MNNREENVRILWEAIEDLFTGNKEFSHMTGDIELCGKTADDVLREIKERERKQ